MGMAVVVTPDLGVEIGLSFPNLYAGRRVYSADEAPEIPVDQRPAPVRAELPVFMSTTALEADQVLLVNRVKPHTDFRGAVESGLAKICAIGLGKQRGAQTIHSHGTRGLVELMPRAARCIIEQTGKIIGGLAIIENPYDQTAELQLVGPDGIWTAVEQALQRRA